jgi:DNA-binding transcriptional LysR family regulator
MIEDINAFCIIAKHQSFSKAARELDLSTPVITRRLARLEYSLGVRLLNRTTRQVTLTEAGNLFYSEVSDILQALEASKESVKSLTQHISGIIRVALPSSLNEYYVMPALKDFLTMHPNLKVHITTGFNLLHLLNNGYDLVIQCGELPHSSFYFKKLQTMKKVVCASPEYLKKYGTPKKAIDLKNHNCLCIESQGYFQNAWIVQDQCEMTEVEVTGNVQMTNGTDLKTLALHGLGIVYLPEYMVQQEINAGKLVALLNQCKTAEHSLYAVYPTKKYLAKKTQLFLDFITNLLVNEKT